MADIVLVNRDFYVKIETEVYGDAAGFSGYYVNEKTNTQVTMPNAFEEVIDSNFTAHSGTVDITDSPPPSPLVVPEGSRSIPLTSGHTFEVGDVFNDGSGNMYRIKEVTTTNIRILGTTDADIADGTSLSRVGNTGVYKSKVNISIPATYIFVIENLSRLISRSQSVVVTTIKKGFV